MLEIPESEAVARQLDAAVRGKTIRKALANTSPHKFAFYFGDPKDYGGLLEGETIGDSFGIGAMLEITAGKKRLLFGDGASLRYYERAADAPAKHQLYIQFEDDSALTVTVQMYGSVYAFTDGEFSNKYYSAAKDKPNPLTAEFDETYFASLFGDEWEKLSAKAFLATYQRIPGLGNGTLQDILFNARVNPKRKMGTLGGGEAHALYRSVKDTLTEMATLGGRDTERDLFGNPGGYETKLSRNTLGKPCPLCGADIQKAAYLGGTVYFCPECQPL